MDKLIYEHQKPAFYILVDERNWILSKYRIKRADKKGDGFNYANKTYYPTLENLLHQLAEHLFRDEQKKLVPLQEKDIVQLRKIQKAIERTHGIIDGLPKKSILSHAQRHRESF